jgi:hypothetical protein
LVSFKEDKQTSGRLHQRRQTDPQQSILTHQQCLEQIIIRDGGNNYKPPHMGKERLLRQGQLPVSIGVSDELQEVATVTTAQEEL